MKLGALLLALLALTGCAARLDVEGSAWGKSGASIYQVTLDEQDCARGAAEAGHTPDLIVGGLVDVARVVIQERAHAAIFNTCMRTKGYTRRS